MLLRIRKAELRDVPALFEMIEPYATERVMLHRSVEELYEHVWEFTVAEEDGILVGCGALKFYSDEIAEIRSLCVAPGLKRGGLGRALTESLLSEAERYGLKTVFALTVVPGFFGKLGFREEPRATLPMKVWRDCIHCEKYFQCDEKTMVIDLLRLTTPRLLSRAEITEVPA
jgi:amino-acid N-acetyltransferase